MLVRQFNEDPALGVHTHCTTVAAGFFMDTLFDAMVWRALLVVILKRSVDEISNVRDVPFPFRSLQNRALFPLVVVNHDSSVLVDAEYPVIPKSTESPISQYHEILDTISNVISQQEDPVHPPLPGISYMIVSFVERAPALNCAYTVFKPVPAESVHAVLAANGTGDDRMTLSLENAISVIQTPVTLRVTEVVAVEAASLLMTNDHVDQRVIAKSVK